MPNAPDQPLSSVQSPAPHHLPALGTTVLPQVREDKFWFRPAQEVISSSIRQSRQLCVAQGKMDSAAVLAAKAPGLQALSPASRKLGKVRCQKTLETYTTHSTFLLGQYILDI